jgi:hypothetical protein
VRRRAPSSTRSRKLVRSHQRNQERKLTAFAAMSLDPDVTLYIMGSFRRGEPTVGDIDLLLTRDPADGKTHAGLLNKLLHVLHDRGILVEDLALPGKDKDLEQKYMGVGRLAPDGKVRRIGTFSGFFLCLTYLCLTSVSRRHSSHPLGAEGRRPDLLHRRRPVQPLHPAAGEQEGLLAKPARAIRRGHARREEEEDDGRHHRGEQNGEGDL